MKVVVLKEEANAELFRFLVLRRLPTQLRTHLFSVKTEDSRELGEMADILWDATRQIEPSVCTVSPSSYPAGPSIITDHEVIAIQHKKNARLAGIGVFQMIHELNPRYLS